MKKFRYLLVGAISMLAFSAAVQANFVSGHVVTRIYFDESGNNVGGQDWSSNCAPTFDRNWVTQWGQVTNTYTEIVTSCS